jgi:hypothetical protein
MEAGEVQSAELQSAAPEPEAEPAGAVEDPLPEAIEDLPPAEEAAPSEPKELGTENWELGTEDDAEADEPAEPKGDDDVLEETPEFLQDAPEHDRLWFEQKPPRDFDFD